jgi:hypothetical protein
VVEADEADLDLAVEHEGELVVAQVRHADVPSARSTSSTYCMFLPTPPSRTGRRRCHLEDVGEGVALRVVVDELDAALLVVVQRANLVAYCTGTPRALGGRLRCVRYPYSCAEYEQCRSGGAATSRG